MGESSAHWEYYFAKGGLTSAAGSAHSECYSATVPGCEGKRGQRAFGVLFLHWIPSDW